MYISSWLRVLTVVRNICAHYGRLHGRKFSTALRLDTKDGMLGLDDNRIFATFFVMAKLYRDYGYWLPNISVTKTINLEGLWFWLRFFVWTVFNMIIGKNLVRNCGNIR